MRSAWAEVLTRHSKRLRANGRGGQGIGRLEKSDRSFVEWAVAKKLSPSDVNEAHKALWTEHIGPVAGRGSIAKNLDRKSGHDMIDEAGMTLEPQDQEQSGEEYEEDGRDEEVVDEAPPSRRRIKAAPVPQVVYVQTPPPARGRPPGRADGYPRASPRTATQRLLPRSDKLRIYKRMQGGKRSYVNDYTVDDIGVGSLHKFIKENVDVEVGDPSGVTTYEVYEVDGNDKEKGSATPITIESGLRQPQDESITQARDALGLLQDLREMEEQRTAKSNELLDEAKKKAVNGGDMTSLMMLMMMQQMQGGNNRNNDGDVALKIIERLRGNSSHIGDLAVALPPLPPMPAYVPPPPAENTLAPVVTQLLAAQLAPKQEKTAVDFMKEMAIIKEMFAPPPRDSELTTLLKILIERTATPPQQQGIEGLVGTFGKIREMVTTLAPQMNAGGLTGALQSIITPELGKALGNVIASGIDKAKPPVPPAPVQQATAQPHVLPDSVRARVVALHQAHDEQTQVSSTVALLHEMYAVPTYSAKLDPALKALLSSNVKPAQVLLSELLREVRAELNTPVFINKVISALILSAGGTPPPELAAPHVVVTPVDPPTVVAPLEVVPPAVVVPPADIVPPALTEVESVSRTGEVVTFARGRETPHPSTNGAETLPATPEPVVAISAAP